MSDSAPSPSEPERGEEAIIREAYARARAEFNEKDVEKYLVKEGGIPLATVLAELEAIQRLHDEQRAQG